MASEAASAVLALARVLYDTVQQVQGNKKQARLLNTRVQAMVAPVRAYDAAELQRPETAEALAFLVRVLTDANAFLQDFRDAGRLRRVVFKGGHTDRFAELHAQLTHAAQALSLGVALSAAASQAELDRARAADEVRDKEVLGVWTVAPATGALVGRTDLLARLDLLLYPAAARKPASRIAIAGMGGTGKSTLAQWAASLHADRFTSGWVLDGSSAETLAAGLSGVAADLLLGELQLDQVARAVRSRLSHGDRAGWLLIVDNVDDAAFAPALAALLPNVGGCILVTSRLAAWDRDGAYVMLALSAMNEAEAVQVLGGTLVANGEANAPGDVAVSTAAMGEVARHVGGLPLALSQARAYVRRTKVGWPTYLGLLDGLLDAPAAAVAAAAATAQLLQPVDAGVLSSLRLSIAAALREQPACAVVLQMLRLLHPDNIPRPIVEDAYARAVQPADGNTLPESVDVHDVLATLADFSIITLSETALATHRLMQRTIVSTVPVDPAPLLALNAAMSASAGRSVDLDPNPGLTAALRVQFAQMLPWLEREFAGTLSLAEALLACAIATVAATGDLFAAVTLSQRALALYEAHLSDADPRHFHARFIATVCLVVSGNYRAGKAAAVELLTRSKACFPADSAFVAMASQALGQAHLFLLEAEEARTLMEAAVAGMTRTIGELTPLTLSSKQVLSTVYGMLGDSATQRDLCERVWRPLEQHYGRCHLYPASAIVYLGNALGALGDYRRELEYVLDGNTRMQQFSGVDNPIGRYLQRSLAIAYGHVGDAHRQRALLQSMLAYYSATPPFGPTHLETARTLALLAESEGALGQPAQQRELAERALVLLQSWLPLDHFEVARTQACLGEALGALGDAAAQLELLERAHTVFERYYGAAHVEVAAMCTRLAAALGAVGPRSEQRVLLERALALEEAAYPNGGDHPEVAKTLYGLALAFDIPVEKQRVLLQRALGLFEKHYGPSHSAVGRVLVSLADLTPVDDTNASPRRRLLERAFTAFDSFYGHDHALTVATRSRLPPSTVVDFPATIPPCPPTPSSEPTHIRKAAKKKTSSTSNDVALKTATAQASSKWADVESWTMEQVATWVQQLDLTDAASVAATLKAEGIRGRHLEKLTEDRLEKVGVRMADRMTFLDARDSLLNSEHGASA